MECLRSRQEKQIPDWESGKKQPSGYYGLGQTILRLLQGIHLTAMSKPPRDTSRNWGERRGHLRGGRLVYTAGFSGLQEHKRITSSPPLESRPFPCPTLAGPPCHNTVFWWSQIRHIHVGPNFDQRSQKEDLSLNGQQEYPIHSLQWKEACFFQMAHWQKDGLNHLHWVTKIRLSGSW